MGKAAEALHDVAMRDGIAMRIRGLLERRQWLGQLARPELIGERFAVLERQVKEESLDREHAPVEFPGDGVPRCLQGKPVCGKGARATAEDMARKLVQHEDERETPVSRLLPA